MVARLGRLFSLACASLLVPAILAGQSSPTITITPGSGTYTAGDQVQIHVDFCSPSGSGLFDASGGVWFNGSMIAGGNPGSQFGCDDYESADVTITIVQGDNVVSASVSNNYGTGSGSVTYTGNPAPPPAPTVSFAPYSPDNRSLSGCVAGCFHGTFTHSTPAYFSLGVGRSVTLNYNTATVRPTPVIYLDVSDAGTPSTYAIQVRRASDNALLTLLNGTSTVYFGAAGGQMRRVAVALDARANGLPTGFTDVTVTVTPDAGDATTVSTRILVVDDSRSLFGIGVEIAGLQRLYFPTGGYSATLTEGDGSALFFRRDCSGCAFYGPAGEATGLTQTVDSANNTIYRRTYLDGSRVDFFSNGRMWRVADQFGNTTTLTWTDTLLTAIRDPMGKVLTLSYTGFGTSTSNKLQAVTDPAGRVTKYWTDAAGHLYRVTDPDTVATNLSYNGLDLLTSVTDRAGTQTDITYDSLRLVATVIGPAIQDYSGATVRDTTRFTPAERVVWQPALAGTSAGNAKQAVRADTLVATVVDAAGATTKYALDRFGAATKVVGPYGETTNAARDTLGRTYRAGLPNGDVVQTTFGPLGGSIYQLAQEKDSITGRTVSYSYSANRVQTISGNVTRVDYVYHTGSRGPVGALDTMYSGGKLFVISTHLPDARGRDTLVGDGGIHLTHTQYDAVWGNTVLQKDPLGNVTHAHFDAVGRVDTAWTATAGKIVYQYDLMNRVTQVTSPLGLVTRYIFGPTTLNRVIDPKGQIRKFAYNARGDLVALHDVADTLKADTLKYDAVGNLRVRRTRRGDLITMTYDLEGRLLSRAGPDFPVDSFKYDPNGRWSVAWNANARDSIVADQVGRLSAAYQKMSGMTYSMSYSYDAQDRVMSRTGPAGGSPVTYRYNASSGAFDTTCAAGACVAFHHDADLLTDQWTFNPGTAWAWSHFRQISADHRSALDTFSVATLTQQLGVAWTYDSAGRITCDRPYNGACDFFARNYGYDAAGRLVIACDRPKVMYDCRDEYGANRSTLTGTLTNTYAYDSAGNRVDSSASPVVGPGDRVLSFRGYTLSYDAAGNLITKSGNGISYTLAWDALGRLKEVDNSGSLVASFTYDALGRRVSKTIAGGVVERYVYDGDNIVLDLDGSNQVKAEYGWYPGGDDLFAVRNPQGTGQIGIAITDPVIGSLRGLVEDSSAIAFGRYHTGAWGTPGTDTGVAVRYRVGGQQYDQETGFYYLGARYYDPKLGKFLSEDPTGIAGGVNLYAYAGNDPVNADDPSGLDCKSTTKVDDPCRVGQVVVTAPGGTGGGGCGASFQMGFGLSADCVDPRGFNPAGGGSGIPGPDGGGESGGTYSGGGGTQQPKPKPQPQPTTKPTWKECMANATNLALALAGGAYGVMATLGGRMLERTGTQLFFQGVMSPGLSTEIYEGGPRFVTALGEGGGVLIENGSFLATAGATLQVTGTVAGGLVGGYLIGAAVVCSINSSYYN